MKFPMLRISIIIIVAIFLCVMFLPNGKNTEMAFGMSEADRGLVLGVSEEILDGNYNISQVVPVQSVALPQNEDVAPAAPLAPEFSGASQYNLDNCKGAVLDEKSGAILYDGNADEVTPIASISKLMTALVFLKNNPGWDNEYVISRSDQVGGGKTYLYAGDNVKVKDLFYTSLVASANTATLALARSTGMSDQEFIAEMNETAQEMGLEKTGFVDPVGLSYKNVSTAKEVVRLAKDALANEDIRKALATDVYEYQTSQGSKRAVRNTNILLSAKGQQNMGSTENLGGKTGFTEAAGYCFVGRFVNKDGIEVISAILDGPSINSRFTLARNLSEWAFNNYKWQ